jgi:hypothetical protein
LLNTTRARQEFVGGDQIEVRQLDNLHIPTLIIYGANSQVLPSYHGLRRHLPACESVLVENAGHFFPMSKPQIFTSIVSNFLNRHSAADRRKTWRISRKLAMQLRYDGQPRVGVQTLNVSASGLLLESTQNISVGSRVGVVANLDQCNQPISLEGKIVWLKNRTSTGRYRLGVEVTPSGDGYQAWQHYLTVE